MVVSFKNYDLVPRYDNTPWTSINIYESSVDDNPSSWVLIDTIALDPVATDPAHPQPVSFTTDAATLKNGWYKVQFVDDAGHAQDTEPVYNAPATEILASLNDVNAHLDGEVIEADANNTELVQISVSRIIKGYLSVTVDQAVMGSWATPETTPDTIREIASMLIAAQVYFSEAARTSLLVEDNNFAQRLYNEAMLMLNKIIDGSIAIVGEGGTTPESTMTMGDLDYFPVDATDRAFTVGQIL